MTIKQLGGVFGRNPTFNDVTIEGQLTFDGDIDVGSDLKIDGDLNVIGTTTLDGPVDVNMGNNIVDFSSGDSGYIKIQHVSRGGDYRLKVNGATADYLDVQNGASQKLIRMAATGDVTIYDNLVIGTSGNGIDFSATAGTGTSELFDDYEEGVWTPAFSGGDYTFTYNKQKGSYTKIGNRVYVDMVLYIDASTAPSGTVDGNLSVTGLPYTFNKQNDVESVGGIIHFKQLFMTTVEAIGYRVTDGASSFLMYDTLATTYPELNYVQASDVNANSRIRLQFSYPTNG